MSEHQFGLVFEDEVGDLFRCSCGVQDWDFAQGREAYARHLEAIAAAAGQRLVLVKWAEGFLGGLSFNEPALQKQEWAKRRAPDVAASIMAAFAAAQAPSAEPGLLDAVYRDRNLVVQAFAAAMEAEGWHVAWGVDPAEPDWPVLYIETGVGQVSWHIPTAERIYEPPDRTASFGPMVWDGHTDDVKAARLRAALAAPAEGEGDGG